jgi:tight adherence protein C
MMIVGASLATVLAIPLLIFALAPDRRAVTSTSRKLSGSARFRERQLSASVTDRLVAPLIHQAARQARRMTPTGTIDATATKLIISGLGNKVSLEMMLGLKLVMGVVLLALSYLLTSGWDLGLRLSVVGVSTAFGFYLPEIYVGRKAEERQAQIKSDLPDVLDQLTVIVEAGLGFDSALGRLVETGDGPLVEEFGRVLRGIRLGQTRAEALEGLGERTDVAEVRQFVAAIKQTEQIGVPIARILRTQSHHMRELKRLAAEERAMKLPVKLVLPMVLCMLPALFVVLIGPVIIRVMNGALG